MMVNPTFSSTPVASAFGAVVSRHEQDLGSSGLQSVPEIIEQKLLQTGFSGEDFALRLVSSYPKREIVVQYKESDLAFISPKSTPTALRASPRGRASTD